MKIRKGYVSNSSSSSFMVLNPPTIKYMWELEEYLKREVTAETRRDMDHILALFQRKQKLNKTEIIEWLSRAIEEGQIPFFDKLFKKEYEDRYNSAVFDFVICNRSYDKDLDAQNEILMSPLVLNFVKYMWLFGSSFLLHICNEKEDQSKAEPGAFAKRWQHIRKCENTIYKMLAENIYNKLKDEGLLESVIIFEVGDDSYLDIEPGYYFDKVDNIIRISNH